jgi:hypothetical protein
MDTNPDPNRQALDAIPIRIRQNDADPTGSGSTTMVSTYFTLYLYETMYNCLTVLFPGCHENQWILDEHGTSNIKLTNIIISKLAQPKNVY